MDVIKLDEGYSFGLGLFETIHVYQTKALFIDEHIERINSSIDNLRLNIDKLKKEEIINYLEDNRSEKKDRVLKIILSDKNRIFLERDYNYTEEQYKLGFKLNIASIKRNENSIFTYHKSLNYAENIYEKRKSIKLGYDEPLFLNSKNQVCEGATSNIFFIKNGEIYTSKLEAGLLNGIIRQYIIKNFDVKEINIKYEDLKNFEECFITNSLLGIMPVNSIENIRFKSFINTKQIIKEYEKIRKNNKY